MPEGTENDRDPSASEPQWDSRSPTDRGDTASRSEPTKHGCGQCPSAAAGGCATKAATEPASAELLSTGDLARRCETTVRTVRFYEEEGLIEPVQRSEGGHRMFEPGQKAKLELIMDLREAGLSLHDIRALFALKSGCASATDAATQMASALETQIEAMQRKIACLRRLREELAGMLATIRECQTCDEPQFHEQCDACDVMNRPEVPRAMRLLWSSSPPHAPPAAAPRSEPGTRGRGGGE